MNGDCSPYRSRMQWISTLLLFATASLPLEVIERNKVKIKLFALVQNKCYKERTVLLKYLKI